MTQHLSLSRTVQFTGLMFWLFICFFVAWTGARVSPGIASAEWYNSLVKPSWNPPAWLFGPVWSSLYTMMGVSAWLVWKDNGFKYARSALLLFLFQLFLNGLWSQLFFNLNVIGWALAEIILLLVAIITTTIHFFPLNRVAGWLMVPYIAWVGFATLLTASIWGLN